MINLVFRNILRLAFLVLFQVGVLNYIEVGGFINPYLYVLFILLLPFETPKWLLLLAGFTIGLILDIFSNTPGMHAAACVLMAYMRPGVMNMVSSRREYEPGLQPIVRDFGFKWFFTYSLILVSAHHFMLFFLEVFSFDEFFRTVFRAALSIISTMILVLLSQFILYHPKK